MPIGTDVKIGFNATEVKKGFSALRTMAGGAFRGMRQIGIGAARQMGTDLFGLLKDVIMFLPGQIEELRKMSNELGNLSTATGEPVANLTRLAKALELGGFEDGMATDMLRELNTKLGEAARGASEAREALHDLGMRGSDFKGKTMAESLAALSGAVQRFKGNNRDLGFIFDRLLGGDLGAKAIPFLKDYSKWMKEASYSSNGLGEALIRQRDSLQIFNRLGSVLKEKWHEALLAAFASTNQVGSHEIGKQIIRYVEGVNVSGLSDVLNRVFMAALRGGEWFATSMKAIGFSGTLKEAFAGMGDMIRQVIRDGVRMGLEEGVNIKSFFKGLNPFTKSTPISSLAAPSGNDQLSADMSQMNRNLQLLVSDQRQGNRSLMKLENANFGWLA